MVSFEKLLQAVESNQDETFFQSVVSSSFSWHTKKGEEILLRI